MRDRERLLGLVQEQQFDTVCHFAAPASARDAFADPLGYFHTNLVGTLNLLQALSDTADQPADPHGLMSPQPPPWAEEGSDAPRVLGEGVEVDGGAVRLTEPAFQSF